jgi:hypothetical protein
MRLMRGELVLATLPIRFPSDFVVIKHANPAGFNFSLSKHTIPITEIATVSRNSNLLPSFAGDNLDFSGLKQVAVGTRRKNIYCEHSSSEICTLA